MAKVILHIDLDAFFASVEIAENPLLKGKPVVVGGRFKRGVVSAASYEARKYGIHAGMPIGQALRLHNKLVVSETNMSLYKKYSKAFFNIVREQFGDKVEVASIDECYVDISEKVKEVKNVPQFIKDFQNYVIKKLKITCSIGVAPNKFLAKMASDMQKPNGLTILRKREIHKLLWPLPIEKMYGIGKKSAPKLREVGVNTIGDLAKSFDNYYVRKILGKTFFNQIERANGNDHSEVIDYEVDPKSIGNSRTFLTNINNLEEVKQEFMDLAKSVSQRIINIESLAFGISIVIKYSDFSVMTRSTSLDEPICNIDEIYLKALMLFEDNYLTDEQIRLLGITLFDIKPKKEIIKQLNIFDAEINETSTNDVINELNNLYGEKIFFKASKAGEKDA